MKYTFALSLSFAAVALFLAGCASDASSSRSDQRQGTVMLDNH